MNVEKYLPLGTIVSLQDAKKLMIIGYLGVDGVTNDQIYDYIGCLYPEGMVSSRKVLLFQHAQIQQVFFLGFQSPEGNQFQTTLKTMGQQLEAQIKKNPNVS